jgi:hypothetical protein
MTMMTILIAIVEVTAICGEGRRELRVFIAIREIALLKIHFPSHSNIHTFFHFHIEAP